MQAPATGEVRLPIVALTMGDVAGIGPELIVKVLSEDTVRSICRPIVIGDPGIFAAVAAPLSAPIHVRVIDNPADARGRSGELDVVAANGVDVREVQPGAVDARAGAAAVRCLEIAVELAMHGAVDGIVSAPLSKQAVHLAGYRFSDELELLASLSGGERPVLFGLAGSIWTVAIALHVPLRKVSSLVTEDRVLSHIELLHTHLSITLSREPSLVVAALNPHAGEGGAFGREEIDAIGPAVDAARASGIDVRGPLPADTIFPIALRAGDDGVVCMYHDQMNIFRKLQDLSECATFFSGLPVPVATTAHGTAFDLAGRGAADPSSLLLAIRHTARSSRRPAVRAQ